MANAIIRIKGEKQIAAPLAESTDQMALSAVYHIGSNSRGITESHDIVLSESDLLEFVFEDETVWLGGSDDIQNIFSINGTANRAITDGVFELPTSLQSADSQRGIIGDVRLKLLKIFNKKERTETVKEKVREYALKLQEQQLEGMSGLYRLDAHMQFQKYTSQISAAPYLLFLHGTASSTHSSFGELKGSDAWQTICKNYEGNIIAFQHETLTKSPLENVLALVKQLPTQCELHLISHSRGGLVGDVLSRFCVSDENNMGFSDLELAYLSKHNRTEDIATIKAIKQAILKKNIRVTKFIRVACPASGTSIASERLDYFFNIALNLMGLAVGSVANPIYNAFKDLVSALVDCKDDLTVLPGLESMNPESPFLKILNNPAPNTMVDGQLMVISGNSQLNFSLKALVIIASKLFFSSKNDLVVNTASMNNGAKRLKPVQTFFDEQANVDHFHYFSNPKTNAAIALALKANENSLIPGFHFQEQHFSEEAMRNAVLNLEGGQVFKNTVTGKRPILVLLPGIMGSNLSHDGKLIWINYFRFLSGKLSVLEFNEANNKLVNAPSLIKTSYKDLADKLSNNYDVVTFPFDWRKQLNQSAQVFNEKIIELLKFGQPIKIVGHSMGGVLVRDFIIQHNDTWQKLNKSTGFKLLFLGSPLGGSFRIPFVLYGYDDIISKIAKIDLYHSKKELINIFCQLPGLLSLLPLNTDADNDFAKEQTWKKMSEFSGDSNWPIPNKKVLEEFGKYRDNIIAQSKNIDWSNAVYIAGKDTSTPSGYSLVKGKLEFLHTAAGDQSVTWDSGIPQKMVQQNNVYYANVSHGALSCSASLFAPIADILSKGSTNLLVKTRPQIRASEQEYVAPPSQDFDISPEGLEKTLLGIGYEEVIPKGALPISVSVSNGDLRFSKYPVLVGHFKKDAILNAEKAIDIILKGSISDLHKLDLYPGDIGTSELFLLNNNVFKGALVLGLGDTGNLTVFQLSQTVEQAVSKYLVNVNNTAIGNFDEQQEIGLSTLLIGCGYGGLTIENSIRAILQGIQNANNKMKNLRQEDAKIVGHVEVVEIYEDKSLSCLYTIHKIAQEEGQSLNISLKERNIKTLLGARERMPIENTDEWWTRITVKQKDLIENNEKIAGLQFNISTGGAREEERNLLTSRNIIEKLLEDISTNNRWSPELAKTIFELLIPNDFKEQLKKQNNINWIVDSHTAAYPWEMLQDEAANARPLSVNAGMIRQLATQEYRINISQVSENTAFILADPDLKGFVFQLPAAKEEGVLVDKILTENAFSTNNVEGNPGQIIKELFSKSYKIIHLAGHGLFNADSSKGSGMLIGDNVFLSTREIAQMSAVPELVFVNCCYLGKMDGEVEAFYTQRYQLAANIGTQLISIGVKAVVVAGWAVDDNAAHDFTKTFYEHLVDGYNFGEAVQNARKHIYEKYKSRNNTWGAYQCYGDPFYKLVSTRRYKNKDEYSFVIAREAEIELKNLINKLELPGSTVEAHKTKLLSISEGVDKCGIRNGRITELEAIVYTNLCDYENASKKYEGLIREELAVFSFAAMEQFCSVRIKNAVVQFLKDNTNRKDSLSTAETVIRDLKILCDYSGTSERLNMLGGVYRRIGLLSNTKLQKIAAYEKAAQCYYESMLRPENKYKNHAFCSWLIVENLLIMAGKRKWGTQLNDYKLWTLAKAEKEINDRLALLSSNITEGDYWDRINIVNLNLCLYLLGKGHMTMEQIIDRFKEVWQSAGAYGKKQSEIELCELLVDAYEHIDGTKAKKYFEELSMLKNSLVNMIIN